MSRRRATLLACTLAVLAGLAAPTVFAGSIPITVDVGTDSGLEIPSAVANHDSVRTSSAGRISGGTSISFDLKETDGTAVEAVELSITLTDVRAKRHRTVLWEGGLAALATQRVDLLPFTDIGERIYSAHVRIAAVRREGVLRPLLPFHGRDIPLSLPVSSSENM